MSHTFMGHASVVRKVRGAAMPQPKELNHGFHGSHGLGIDSGRATFIRVIRAIRGNKSWPKGAILTDLSTKNTRNKEYKLLLCCSR
jgi:hypothetical protein